MTKWFDQCTCKLKNKDIFLLSNHDWNNNKCDNCHKDNSLLNKCGKSNNFQCECIRNYGGTYCTEKSECLKCNPLGTKRGDGGCKSHIGYEDDGICSCRIGYSGRYCSKKRLGMRIIDRLP